MAFGHSRPYDDIFAEDDAHAREIAGWGRKVRELEEQRADLLAACKAAITTIDACIMLGLLDRDIDQQTREMLRTAIAKAEGKEE